MAKITIKNGPKNPFQMAKLITEVATREIEVPANGVVDATKARGKKNKKG